VRRTLLALFFVVAAVAAGLGFSAPASSRQGQVGTLTITKVVDGAGPTGGYVIDFDCVPNGGKGGGGSASGSSSFGTAGPGVDESQDVVLDGPSLCTVTETESNGAASVTYACEFTPGTPPGSPDSDFATEGQVGRQGCLDDQSGAIAFPGDHLTITVTNAFEPDVLPDDEEPPPAVEPDVVTATPTFTG